MDGKVKEVKKKRGYRAENEDQESNSKVTSILHTTAKFDQSNFDKFPEQLINLFVYLQNLSDSEIDRVENKIFKHRAEDESGQNKSIKKQLDVFKKAALNIIAEAEVFVSLFICF